MWTYHKGATLSSLFDEALRHLLNISGLAVNSGEGEYYEMYEFAHMGTC